MVTHNSIVCQYFVETILQKMVDWSLLDAQGIAEERQEIEKSTPISPYDRIQKLCSTTGLHILVQSHNSDSSLVHTLAHFPHCESGILCNTHCQEHNVVIMQSQCYGVQDIHCGYKQNNSVYLPVSPQCGYRNGALQLESKFRTISQFRDHYAVHTVSQVYWVTHMLRIYCDHTATEFVHVKHCDSTFQSVVNCVYKQNNSMFYQYHRIYRNYALQLESKFLYNLIVQTSLNCPHCG